MITLAQFRGDWRLLRRIADANAGQDGAFEGVARFVPQGDGLLYHECGELRLGMAAPMRAERSYLWREAAGRIVVQFDDGRPFHSFDGAVAAADHLCGEDLYQVHYDFADWPDWRATWRVRGPRKDYEMVSLYSPL